MGWPYATPEQLAVALRISVTDTNRQLLTDCVTAAAEEIDEDLDRTETLPDPAPTTIVRVNIQRAVEWWKATDANNGQIGSDLQGELSMPFDGFQRYSVTIRPWKQQWGIA